MERTLRDLPNDEIDFRETAYWNWCKKATKEINKNTCQCCGEHGGIFTQMDIRHVVDIHSSPKSRFSLENLTLLCNSCNRAYTRFVGGVDQPTDKETLILFIKQHKGVLKRKNDYMLLLLFILLVITTLVAFL